jgi:hypothetical protein
VAATGHILALFNSYARTGDTAPATVTISTLNSAPVADAGLDQTVFVGDTVTLDGSASSDVEGDALSLFWSLTTIPVGSAASLSDPTAVMPTFDVDVYGTYLAQLIVHDGHGNSMPDGVTISVLQIVATSLVFKQAEWGSDDAQIEAQGIATRGSTVFVSDAGSNAILANGIANSSGGWQVSFAIPTEDVVPCRLRAESGGQIAELDLKDAPADCGGVFQSAPATTPGEVGQGTGD